MPTCRAPWTISGKAEGILGMLSTKKRGPSSDLPWKEPVLCSWDTVQGGHRPRGKAVLAMAGVGTTGPDPPWRLGEALSLISFIAFAQAGAEGCSLGEASH